MVGGAILFGVGAAAVLTAVGTEGALLGLCMLIAGAALCGIGYTIRAGIR
jgi:hypothetical protein